MSSSAPSSLTSTLLSQPLHRAQTYPLSPSLHPRLHPGPVLPATSSLVSLLPPCSQRDPVNTGVRSCPSPAQGPLVAPSQVKALCLVTHRTPHNSTGQHTPCRGCRFYQGKSPHALEPMFHNEKPTHRKESSPHSPQLKKTHVKTQGSQK